MTKTRNELFSKINHYPSFTHTPSKNSMTTAIRQFEAEGLITITQVGQSDDQPLWLIARGV